MRGYQDQHRSKTDEWVLFDQKNAPVYKPLVSMAAVRDCGFEIKFQSSLHVLWNGRNILNYDPSLKLIAIELKISEH